MKSFGSIPLAAIKAILAFLVVSSFTLSLSSCFEYPEGPAFTLTPRDMRLEGNWGIKEVKDANGNSIINTFMVDTVSVNVDSLIVTDTISGLDSTVYDTTINISNFFIYKYQTMTTKINRTGSNTVSIFTNGIPWTDATWDLTVKNDFWALIFTRLEGKNTLTQRFYTIQKLTQDEFIYRDENNLEFDWEKL